MFETRDARSFLVRESMERLVARERVLRQRLGEWKALLRPRGPHPELDYDDGMPAPLVVLVAGDWVELQWDLGDSRPRFVPALPDGCYTPAVGEWLAYGIEVAGVKPWAVSTPTHVPWVLPLPNELRLLLLPPPPDPCRGVRPEVCESFAQGLGFRSFAQMWDQTITLQGPGYLQRWATPLGDDVWAFWDVPDLERVTLRILDGLTACRAEMLRESLAYHLGFASLDRLYRASERVYRDAAGETYLVARLPFYVGHWAAWPEHATSIESVQFFETREAAIAYLARALDGPEPFQGWPEDGLHLSWPGAGPGPEAPPA